MDTCGEEACALKVARALSYINFSSLEKWFGHPGFIKIFQGLKGEGTDLGWAVLLGAIQCAAAGDRHLPKQVIYRILRENRVTVQHLQDLFGDCSPVRPDCGGLSVGGMDIVPTDAAPEMNAALNGFGQGRMAMHELGDELYRLHTGEMRDTLYYHALLTARSVRHPISAHMLWKALTLLPAGALRDEAVASALSRLEELQGEHLGAAMRAIAPALAPSPGLTPAAPPAPIARPVPGHPSPPGPQDLRERSARLLRAKNIPAMSDRSSRLTALTGYDGPMLDGLLEPLLLRSFADGDGPPSERGPVLAVGPHEVDKPAILRCVAQMLGLRFTQVPCSELRAVWTGELESELLHILDRACHNGVGNSLRPVMLVFSDRAHPERNVRIMGNGATSPEDVASALACLFTGPRRQEATGKAGNVPVIPVVALSSHAGPSFRFEGDWTIIHLEPPKAAELERLLILNLVGRFWRCDIDNISFAALGEEAVGLAAGDIGRVAQRAKLRALGRRARQLGAGLISPPARLRAEMIQSYMITQEDIGSVIKTEKMAHGGARPVREGRPPPAGAPLLQADLLRWEPSKRED